MQFSAPDPTKGRKRYHLGLALDCPVDQARAGGRRLVKRTERVSFDRHNRTQRAPVLGEYVWLNEQELEQLGEAIARQVVRQVGKKEFVAVSTGYRPWIAGFKDEPGPYGPKKKAVMGTRRVREPREGDVPLATWVYLDEAEQDPVAETPHARPFLETPEPARGSKNAKGSKAAKASA